MTEEQFDAAINSLIADSKKFAASGRAYLIDRGSVRYRHEIFSCSVGQVSVIWPVGLSVEESKDVESFLYDLRRKILGASERAEAAQAKAPVPEKTEDPSPAPVQTSVSETHSETPVSAFPSDNGF